MLLTAVFPDGGTAFAASLNQELPSAVSEGSVNKLSDSSSEEDTDSETMPSAEAADADDASKELQDVPLAPAVGGEPLPAEELAREEKLYFFGMEYTPSMVERGVLCIIQKWF
jgi:hypothetical protein